MRIMFVYVRLLQLWNFTVIVERYGNPAILSNPVLSEDKTQVFIGSGGTPGSGGRLQSLKADTSYSVFVCHAGDCVGTWGTGTDITTCQSACSPNPGLYKCVQGVFGEDYHDKNLEREKWGVAILIATPAS